MRFLVNCLLAGLGCALVCGCASDGSSVARPGTRYESKTGDYSVRVPHMPSPYVRQSEVQSKDASTLSFVDDEGGLVRIEAWRIDPTLLEKFNGADQPRALDDFYDRVTLATQFRAVSPEARPLYREHVQTQCGPALFVATYVPHGSTLALGGGAAPFDCVRSVLLFVRQNEVFCVMNQSWPKGGVPMPLRKEDLEGTLGNLRATAAAISFHKDPQVREQPKAAIAMGSAPWHSAVLKSGTTYTSPTGLYTLLVARSENDRVYLRERSHETDSSAGFVDDQGHFLLVETKHIPGLAEWKSQQVEELEDTTYEQLIFETDYAATSTEARTVARSRVTTAAGSALFVAVFVPNGDSVPIAEGVEMRSDALRAYLIFPRGNELFVVGNREVTQTKGRTMAYRCKLLQDELTSAVGAMRFQASVAKSE